MIYVDFFLKVQKDLQVSLNSQLTPPSDLNDYSYKLLVCLFISDNTHEPR